MKNSYKEDEEGRKNNYSFWNYQKCIYFIFFEKKKKDFLIIMKNHAYVDFPLNFSLPYIIVIVEYKYYSN